MPGAHKKKRSKKPNAARVGAGGSTLAFKEDGQLYAVVTKAVGDRRFMTTCDDGVERMCKLRGSMRRSQWVCMGDVLLVSLRDFEDKADDDTGAKADVLLKYSVHEVRLLKKYGELNFLDVAETVAPQGDDDGVVFEDEFDISDV